MGTIRSILSGLWRGLDGLRKFLHLILLLVLFGFVFGAFSTQLPSVPAKAALVIKPEGEIVEQLSGDPIERAIAEAQGVGQPETLLWDLVEAIRHAKTDDRVQALVIDVDYFTGAGQPTLHELGLAVADFRKSGKKVIARGVMFLQDQYLLAANAEEIYLDPLGFVLIDGYDRFRMYYKEALDKLGIDMNVFKVGAYKSAAEVFTRTDMSPEDREESLVYLNALWKSYQQAIERARKLSAGTVAKYVADFDESLLASRGQAAQVALEAKLVTGVKTAFDVEKRVIELVGEDERTGSFHAVTHEDYGRIVRAEKTLSRDGRPRVGVVVASGEIIDGEQPPGTIGGESAARLVRDARLDDDIKAVVLRVDSPGGSMLASEQIHRELLALKSAGKPLVVSMGDLAASGGYYIAAPADEIWASPATITGSIGVFATIPTFDRTLDKIGVGVDGVGTTELSGQLRLDRPLQEPARQIIQALTDRSYADFLERVAAGRHTSVEKIDEIAQGRVWIGTDARRLGLVDHLGSFDDAVKAAAERGKLTDYEVDFVEPELSWAQELALSVRSRVAAWAFADATRPSALAKVAQRFEPLQREVARWQRLSSANRVYAYCFCAVQ
jgi:protease-4